MRDADGKINEVQLSLNEMSTSERKKKTTHTDERNENMEDYVIKTQQ